MDRIYQAFKAQCRTKTLSLFAQEFSERSMYINACKDRSKTLNHSQAEDDEEDPQAQSLEIKEALKDLSVVIKPPTLNNEDLGCIVNGREGENLCDRPFDFTFTREIIPSANARVGFVSFTRACLKNKNVRHEFHQDNKNENVEGISEKYHQEKKGQRVSS